MQVKGVKTFNAAHKSTFTRANVSVQAGWVATSGNRQDWIFAQFAKDMSPEGVEFYFKLNNLGMPRARLADALAHTDHV
jgi:hypothetical protein